MGGFRCMCLILLLVSTVCCYVKIPESDVGDKITDEEAARAWLDQYNRDASDVYYAGSVISWNYNTNITEYNQNLTLDSYLEQSKFQKNMSDEANRFAWKDFTDRSLRRQFRVITNIGLSDTKDENLLKQLLELESDMQKIYSTGKVCYKSSDNCLALEPDLTRLLANSKDYSELLQAWKGWRDVTGKKMRNEYEQFVNLSNQAIRSIGDFDNYADYWLSWYDTPAFEEQIIAIMEQLKPLYLELHTYVRETLKKIYPNHNFPTTGHIPAHLLGNMWAQGWDNLYDVMQPFKNKTRIDVTQAMVSQNYTVDKMFKVTEEFFTSLGLPKLRDNFWKNSMLERPSDREVNCHGSAWDFMKNYDYRIKMCTDITMGDMYTVHHEMGHTHYQMAYENLSIPFRDGANPGFHEAIGDTIALSVVTPEHLHKIGLLDDVQNDPEGDVNFLMSVALDKIPFIPFAFTLDSWRWGVFRGETPPQRYNSKWWELRCKYQGVSPPVERTEEDFDPGAKYHVPFQVSYIRYFVAFILQFQFQKSLCEIAGHQGPLYRCDIYNSTAAGDKLSAVLSLGSSKSWPDALEIMTGQRNMDASAFIEYFQPLTDWLQIQNKDKRLGWTDLSCPSPTSGLIDSEEAAWEWLEQNDNQFTTIFTEMGNAEWQYATNITDHNSKIKVASNLKFAEYEQASIRNSSMFDWTSFQNKTLRRLYKQVNSTIGINSLEDKKKLKQYNSVISEMKAITSKANVCLSDGQCHQITPGLTKVFSESRNYSLLTEAWEEWRNATGRQMKDLYQDMVNISNEALTQLGFEDTGAYWRSWYETSTLQENLENLLIQLEPLYKNLHAYIRRKLRNVYGEEHFPASGHVPAHLFGNMWGQQWNNIYDLVEPFKGKPSLDITPKLIEMDLKPLNLFKVAEEFFTSLGLLEMPQSFWDDSMFVKPQDREVMCHASAWDFHNGKDFRIKMCTKVDMEDLMTIHHEMGHIQYFLQYKDLPTSFRNGANNGFHEAVGDVMELSVSTPEHLHKIGFLDNVVQDSESDINFLMSMALKKIAFLPFGYLIDQWRWSVFNGETTPDKYNEKWWKLRCKLQGMSPPTARTADDFDPGAKYHVASNTPYIRYFVSFVIQFQFHQALCLAAGHTGPLHRCDIYQSRTAGTLLRNMLEMGSSQPWQDAMETITGQRDMNAEPLMEYFKPLTDWLIEQNQNDTIGWLDDCPQQKTELINDVESAEEWLLNYNKDVQKMDAYYMLAYWNYTTNITDYNQQKQVDASILSSDFSRKASLNGSMYSWRNLSNPLMRKQFALIVDHGTSTKDKEKTKERSNLMAKLKSIYAKAQACLTENRCLTMEPDLKVLMSNSRDQAELLQGWRAWRNATGRNMKEQYARFVELSNEGARENGYNDTGEYWRSWYDTPSLRDDLVKLLDKLQVLYLQLHTYVKGKLETFYGVEHLPRSGHIPAHLLGNMWGQNWMNIYDIVQPFKDKKVHNITKTMLEKNFTVNHMFRLSEEFFVSLNLSTMPLSFWENSMLERPTDGRDVVCHASAWDFGNGKDFRIKMCTDVSFDTFQVIHHEMGHIQYYLQYKDQPWVFRYGANPGFHEAVGDVMAMSVVTPAHLHKLGLLNTVEDDFESDINFLMLMALEKIAFLPFGYLIDQWRWSVFSGETTPDKYNEKWWELRCKYQGVSPPVPRSEKDFDPGSKYHVPGNTPYIRYFISHVVQFQFHKALCDAAGHTGPLHKCDIYQSKEAGKLLGDMLKLGSSEPWQVAMEAITGQRTMSVEPIIDYFQPLIDWLTEQNVNKPTGWLDKCQQPRSSLINDEELARQWLNSYNQQAGPKYHLVSESEWANLHEFGSSNSDMEEARTGLAKFNKEAWLNASRFDWEEFTDKDLQREFIYVREHVGTDALADSEKLTELNSLISDFNQMKIADGLKNSLATCRNYSQLNALWLTGQRASNDTGKDKYAEFVKLSNEAASELGFMDTSEFWRSQYDSMTFQQDVDGLLEQVKPLYQELHCYVRTQLRKLYGGERFPVSGQIPAHILGNLIGENWKNLYDLLMPYKDIAGVDITPVLKARNYTTEMMFHKAEEFFTSIGLPKLPVSFWEKSMFMRPSEGQHVKCNPLFLDLGSQDIRVSMCTDVDQANFVAIHEMLAHIQYSRAYSRQPFSFQGAPTPGFEEAVAGLVGLSVSSSTHLHDIGFLETSANKTEDTLNILMKTGLQKIPSLPFGYLIDKWQRSVFNRETTPDKYNEKWWKLRYKYQGMSPPGDESDAGVFYPGTEGHGSITLPYIRYFVGTVLEFQLLEGLCKAAGHTGPLHTCDIYPSRQAGALLMQALGYGRSLHWQDILETLTDQRKIDAASLVKYFQPLYDWLKEQNKDQSAGWDDDYVALTIGERASDWLKYFNQEATMVYRNEILTQWNYSVNISADTEVKKTIAILDTAAFAKQSAEEASQILRNDIRDHNTRRQLKSITAIGTNAMIDKVKLKRLQTVQSRMQSMYRKGEVCLTPDRCLALEPGLTEIMATSRNQTVLLNAWKGWRATTRSIKPYYNEFVDLSNEGIRDLGYSDTGEYWRSQYETPHFASDLESLLTQLTPLYENIHAYVRQRLGKVYSLDTFPTTGHIPAHLLGNMWGHSWGNIYDLVTPYKGSPIVDVTPELKRQGYTVKRMFKTAEEFFVSLGLSPLPVSFWNNSMLEKPVGRDALCQASAWDMLNQSDVRVKMCATVNMDSLFAIHHELGHVQYSIQYSNQPIVFRRGANPGFPEAVGDVVSLSVSTPSHLSKIGLLNASTDQEDFKADINFLMKTALEKIAFLPFGYLVDQWRWSVFEGETSPERYNEKWWKLRCKYQGVSAPVERTAEDFDPGAEYHIPDNDEYIRSFVSSVIQFQFHKALCDAAGHTGPLHKCDIYHSKEAGKLLGDMLKLGSSVPWQEAMTKLTGQSKMDVGPLLEYFQPLSHWLQRENYRERPGWTDACPTQRGATPPEKHFNNSVTPHTNTSFNFLLFLAILCKIVLV